MNLVLSMVVAAGLLCAAFHYGPRVGRAGEGPYPWRWVAGWAARGLGLPLLAWMWLNCGFSSYMPPLMPRVARIWAKGGNWFPAFLDVSAAGLWVIASCWASVTFGWFLAAMPGLLPDERDRTTFKALFWSRCVWLVPAALCLLWLLGWMQIGLAVLVLVLPLVHETVEVFGGAALPPDYSRARGKLNIGRPKEAEWEILQTLEQHQDDFEGWMILAELYASQFFDLQAADQTVRELCLQPNVTPPQLSVALHRLADWHLKFGQNPVAARAALEEICRRLPGTHLARMAEYRKRQMPSTREALVGSRRNRPYRLPTLAANLEPTAADGPILDRAAAVAKANQCVTTLCQNRDDTAAREQLARLLAEDLEQTDQAIEQVNLLLGMRNQPPEKRAAWLAWLAAWQLRGRREDEAGQRTLERLVDEYPQSPQAFAAQRRLNLIRAEAKLRRAREKTQARLVVPSPPEVVPPTLRPDREAR